MSEIASPTGALPLHGQHVDGFAPHSPRRLTQCAFRGCRNSARVTVFYTMPDLPPDHQDRARICTKHALFTLANQALEVHKHGRGT